MSFQKQLGNNKSSSPNPNASTPSLGPSYDGLSTPTANRHRRGRALTGVVDTLGREEHVSGQVKEGRDTVPKELSGGRGAEADHRVLVGVAG
jgi:hypothetical protein